jgi:dCTP deaminase
MNARADSESIWDELNLQPGILTDTDILFLGERGCLITENFSPEQVYQTCYDLRVGSVAYYLNRPETERRFLITTFDLAGEMTQKNLLVMRPFDVVTIVTLEKVHLPADIVARIISKGYLFSIGLNPVITFVDPGFKGHLGSTLVNLSKRTVRMEYGDPICKIEFEKLPKPVDKPYSKGAHDSAEKTWFFDTSKFLPCRDLSNGAGIDLIFEEDVEYFGEPIDVVYAKLKAMEAILKKVERRTFLITAIPGSLIAVSLLWGLVQVFLGQVPEIQGEIINALLAGIFGLVLFLLGRRSSAREKE